MRVLAIFQERGDCHTVKHLKALGCRKGVITEALKLVERRMENNI